MRKPDFFSVCLGFICSQWSLAQVQSIYCSEVNSRARTQLSLIGVGSLLCPLESPLFYKAVVLFIWLSFCSQVSHPGTLLGYGEGESLVSVRLMMLYFESIELYQHDALHRVRVC